MIPKVFKEQIQLNDGRVITLETGKLAKQADGSGCGTYGKLHASGNCCIGKRGK